MFMIQHTYEKNKKFKEYENIQSLKNPVNGLHDLYSKPHDAFEGCGYGIDASYSMVIAYCEEMSYARPLLEG